MSLERAYLEHWHGAVLLKKACPLTIQPWKLVRPSLTGKCIHFLAWNPNLGAKNEKLRRQRKLSPHQLRKRGHVGSEEP
eukprot:275968-Pelagomonas_calceolata.AAC.1